MSKTYYDENGNEVIIRYKGGKKITIPVNTKENTLVIRHNKGVNEKVWNKSLTKLEELQKELPQVQKLIKSYNGEGVIIRGEVFDPDGINHTELFADGDTNPKTGIISINAAMRLSDKNSMEAIEKACEKSGTFGKYGRSLSSTSPLHTAVHEYGHIIHLALCIKANKGKDKSAILGDYSTGRIISNWLVKACTNTNTRYTEFQHSLSSVASALPTETFSEAIANAVLAPNEKNATSAELWKLIKKELG